MTPIHVQIMRCLCNSESKPGNQLEESINCCACKRWCLPLLCICSCWSKRTLGAGESWWSCREHGDESINFLLELRDSSAQISVGFRLMINRRNLRRFASGSSRRRYRRTASKFHAQTPAFAVSVSQTCLLMARRILTLSMPLPRTGIYISSLVAHKSCTLASSRHPWCISIHCINKIGVIDDSVE